MKRIPAPTRKLAVERILAGKSTPSKEAKQLGVTRQAVSQWVAAAKKGKPPVSRPAPATKPAPAKSTPPEKEPEASPAATPAGLDPLPNAIGYDTGEVDTSDIPEGDEAETITHDSGGEEGGEEKAAPESLDGDDIVDGIESVKQLVGLLACEFALGLDTDEPKVERLISLKPLTKKLIKKNAAHLGESITDSVSGPEIAPWVVGGALLLEFGVSGYLLYKMAKKKGNLTPEKFEERGRKIVEKMQEATAEETGGEESDSQESTSAPKAPTASSSPASPAPAKAPAPGKLLIDGRVIETSPLE